VTYGAFVRAISRIAEELPTNSQLQREARAVSAWIRDPAKTTRQLDIQSNLFDRLLARSVRQRNAVVHGVKTVQEVVASVEPFIRRLAASLVAQAVVSAAVGEQPVASLESQRVKIRRKLWLLREGTGPVDRVLFGEEKDE